MRKIRRGIYEQEEGVPRPVGEALGGENYKAGSLAGVSVEGSSWTARS